MSDYTAEVIRLEGLYEGMQIAKKRIADEIRSRHRVAIRHEIEEAQRGIEYEFARELATSHASGLPGQVIRSNVLRTQDWGRWKKWRELAEIQPERVTVANAKAEAKAQKDGYAYDPETGVLTITKDQKKEDCFLLIDVAKSKERPEGLPVPAGDDPNAFVRVGRATGDGFAFTKHVRGILEGL